MESTLFTRLGLFMTHKGLNDNQITVQAKIAVGTLGKQRRSGKGLSYDSLVKILTTYPELNPTWLLLGTGEMLLSNSKDVSEEVLKRVKELENTLKNQDEKINLLIDQLDNLRAQMTINQELMQSMTRK